MELLLFITILSVGVATGETVINPPDTVYASQIVTGHKDANGKIHLKGVGGEQGYALISEPRIEWPALSWGGASR